MRSEGEVPSLTVTIPTGFEIFLLSFGDGLNRTSLLLSLQNYEAGSTLFLIIFF